MQKVPNEALFDRLQILCLFPQKYCFQLEVQGVKYSFITYIWSKGYVFFCYSVYFTRDNNIFTPFFTDRQIQTKEQFSHFINWKYVLKKVST